MSNFDIEEYNKLNVNPVKNIVSKEPTRLRISTDIEIFERTGKITVIPMGVSGISHKGHSKKQKGKS